MTKKYDFIIIGAGPNGLATAAYLSKAGLRPIVLEKRYELGGGLATEEVTYPGYFHNTHAIYMMMVDFAPIYNDFNFEDYKCEHIYPSLQFAMPLKNGRALCLYNDVERSCKSIEQFSKKDADTYREIYNKFKRYVDEFIGPATYAPPIPVLDQVVKLQNTEVGREIMEYSEKTPKEIVDELFENEIVKTLMLYVACHWGVQYDLAGLGYLAILYINRATNYRLVKGGSHMIAQALGKIVHENGGVIINNQRIKKINVVDGIAKGVEMEDGTIIEADKAVISSVDPQQTFLKLVGEDNLDKDFAQKIKDWKWEKYSFFEVHLALEEPPNFSAASANPEINKAFIYLLGYENVGELIEDFDKLYSGELSDKGGITCSFPSVLDPSQAPSGRATGIICRLAPYNIKEGRDKWYNYKFKEEQADKYFSLLERYAPNLVKDKILQRQIITPLDIENRFPDMREASFKQGAYTPFQMGYLRPNEECSRSRTPVKNLYLAGSSCYPGGCVIWGAGYLAANAIAEDFGINKWWAEPEILVNAKKKGYL